MPQNISRSQLLLWVLVNPGYCHWIFSHRFGKYKVLSEFVTTGSSRLQSQAESPLPQPWLSGSAPPIDVDWQEICSAIVSATATGIMGSRKLTWRLYWLSSEFSARTEEIVGGLLFSCLPGPTSPCFTYPCTCRVLRKECGSVLCSYSKDNIKGKLWNHYTFVRSVCDVLPPCHYWMHFNCCPHHGWIQPARSKLAMDVCTFRLYIPKWKITLRTAIILHLWTKGGLGL